MLFFHDPFFNESLIFTIRFVGLFDLDHFVATLTADKPIDLGPKVLLLSLFFFNLFIEDILKCIAKFELPLRISLVVVLEEAFVASFEINFVVSF